MGKTLYLECYSGISGDMTVAALLDLGADRKKLEQALAGLSVKGFRTEITRVSKSGLDACDFNVILDKGQENHDHDMEYLHGHSVHHKEERHSHSHFHETESGDVSGHIHERRGISEIKKIIRESGMTERARETALKIFGILAEAESKAHGVPVDEVHFHEVGAVDSIVDIAAAAICLDDLDITQVIVPGLCEGTGFVRCQHGRIPVPVPAVMNIVQKEEIPLRITGTEGELVTPTGAAIVAAVRTSGRLPENFVVEKTGIGAGKRQYDCPGILRAMLIREKEPEQKERFRGQDAVWKLETNVDDCTGEELGNVLGRLFEAGARDVYYTPVYMKKNRPAYELSVICSEEKIKILENIIFRETTTIGIRRVWMERTVLEREIREFSVEGYGVKAKICTLPDGTRRCYPEYDSAAALAERLHTGYRAAWERIRDCWDKER